jgi:hypothetical protein
MKTKRSNKRGYEKYERKIKKLKKAQIKRLYGGFDDMINLNKFINYLHLFLFKTPIL